jgi:hypothetical protein
MVKMAGWLRVQARCVRREDEGGWVGGRATLSCCLVGPMKSECLVARVFWSWCGLGCAGLGGGWARTEVVGPREARGGGWGFRIAGQALLVR